MTRFCPAVMIMGTLCFAAPCLADDKDILSDIISDPLEQQQVLDSAKKAAVIVQNPCETAEFAIVGRAVLFKSLTLGEDGKLTAGAWKQTVAERGCGQERILNVFLGIDGTRALRITPLLPGTTHADPVLQQDAGPYASMGAGTPEASCTTGYIADTEFLREHDKPIPGGKSPPWDEVWTLVRCNKKALVTMHFIPDAAGTTIATSAEETQYMPIATPKP